MTSPGSDPTRIAETPAAAQKSSLIERLCERAIFHSRWLLAPFYLGLIVGLVLLLFEFVRHTVELVSHIFSIGYSGVVIGVLSLIDLSLMSNLVLMVMFAGYENFVSRLDFEGHQDKPDWISHVEFGDLKLKLMTSIVAISAIHVLEAFMNVASLSDRELAWAVGIHIVFIVSGVLLAIMDRLTRK